MPELHNDKRPVSGRPVKSRESVGQVREGSTRSQCFFRHKPQLLSSCSTAAWHSCSQQPFHSFAGRGLTFLFNLDCLAIPCHSMLAAGSAGHLVGKVQSQVSALTLGATIARKILATSFCFGLKPLSTRSLSGRLSAKSSIFQHVHNTQRLAPAELLLENDDGLTALMARNRGHATTRRRREAETRQRLQPFVQAIFPGRAPGKGDMSGVSVTARAYMLLSQAGFVPRDCKHMRKYKGHLSLQLRRQSRTECVRVQRSLRKPLQKMQSGRRQSLQVFQ